MRTSLILFLTTALVVVSASRTKLYEQGRIQCKSISESEFKKCAAMMYPSHATGCRSMADNQAKECAKFYV